MNFRCGRTLIAAILTAAMAHAAAVDADWRGGPTKDWFVNWDKALAEARKTGKAMFLLCTGSDWCVWCKRLRANVLDKPEFAEFAKEKLVLVYLDSPNNPPLGKEQKAHNRLVTKTLPFGGGVPSVLVMNAEGEKLGLIGGGGLGRDEYLEKLRGILSAKGERIKGDDARLLFTDGYAAMVAKIAARRAALPPVTKADFKARLTGVAIVNDRRSVGLGEVTFVAPDTPLTVFYGQTVLFRVEYDFPEDYGARVWLRDDLCDDGKRRSRNFVSNPSPFYRGKGTAYGFLAIIGRQNACKLRSVKVDTNSDPELDNCPDGWDIITVPVNLDFKGDDEATAWMTDCGEAQKTARATGKLMLVYNYPRSLLRRQHFTSDPDFLEYATNRYVLLNVDGFGEEVKVSFPWAYNSGWPNCRILDAEGTSLSPDSNNRSRWSLGNSDYFGAKGGQMLELLKGFDKAYLIMPDALPKKRGKPSQVELAKLHDALSQLPETFVNYYYLNWAEKLVAADPDGSRGYRSHYTYVARVHPQIKEIIKLKSSYYNTLYDQTRKRIRAEGGEQGGRNWSRNVDIVTGELAEEWGPKFVAATHQLDQMDADVPDGDSRFRFDNLKRDIGRILDSLRKAHE